MRHPTIVAGSASCSGAFAVAWPAAGFAPVVAEKDLLRRYAEATGAPVDAPGVFSKAKKIFK